MLPNCPLSLANPNTEKVKTMTFILAEAEKSDLIFCCHRSFPSPRAQRPDFPGTAREQSMRSQRSQRRLSD